MTKLLLLLVCCTFLSRSLRAQSSQPDKALPQKLELKKADLYGTSQPVYFTKNISRGETDGVRSLMYNGAAKRDSFNLQLPKMQNKKFELQIKARQPEPLFRRQ